MIDHLGLSFLAMFDFMSIKATYAINFSLVGRREYGEKKFSRNRVSIKTALSANQFFLSYKGNLSYSSDCHGDFSYIID